METDGNDNLYGNKRNLHLKAMSYLFDKFEEVNKQRLIDLFDENEQLGNVPDTHTEVYFIRYQLQLIPNPMAEHVPSWSPKVDVNPKLEEKLETFLTDQIKARRAKKLISNFIVHGLNICMWAGDIKLVFPEELVNVFNVGDLHNKRAIEDHTIYSIKEKHKEALSLIPERIIINMLI